MDLKFKGRTWVGNIYHKIEAIRQDFDDLVTKDPVKYMENQVQTVGESVKKIYSNMVHDLLPPLGDNKQGKAEAVTRKQNNVIASNMQPMACIKEKHKHATERKSSEEQDPVDLKSSDPSEVDSLVLFSPPPCADFPQVAENGSQRKETSDGAIHNNIEMVHEGDTMGEGYPEASYSSSPGDENSSGLALNQREQHLLNENSEFPVDGHAYGPLDISSGGDQRDIVIAEFSQRNFVEDVGLRTSQKCKTTCRTTDLSVEAKTGLFFKQDAETAVYKKSEIVSEENATIEEHPASEHAISLESKNSWESLCAQEQDPVGYDFYALEGKSKSVKSSADEDHKIADLVKCSPEILVPDTVLRVVPVKQDADSIADPVEEALTNHPSEHDGCDGFTKVPVANVRKEHIIVDNRSYPICESSSELSLHPREKHPETEDSTTLHDKSFCKSLCCSTDENFLSIDLVKSSPETSVDDDRLRVFQEEEGEYSRPYCSNETETELSLDGYCSCMSSDFDVEENVDMEKHATSECIGFHEHRSSWSTYLCSRKLLVETDDFSSPNGESSFRLSLTSRTEDHRNTIPAKFSPVHSVNAAGFRSSQKDETTTNNVSDVVNTDPSSELVSSGTSLKHKVAETEASSSSVSTELLDLLEFAHANSTQKPGEVSCDYTDSSGCLSISSASSSVLPSGNTAVNLIPAFPGTASSADTSTSNQFIFESSGSKQQRFFEGASVDDIVDTDMETIDLSDEAKLEESCIIVDNELLYAASRRPRKLRSCKKLIEEVFASRKRLIKEYEQLAIWYGDIDTDISSQSERLPCMQSASRSAQLPDLGESEWELL